MDSSRGDSRYNLNYSMSSIGLSLADQTDMYSNPAAVAALGGRPPSGGIPQNMGGVGFGGRTGGLIPNVTQCQSLVSSNANNSNNAGQQRGVKRAGSDCYEDHHRGVSSGLTVQSLQGLESCTAGGNGQQMEQPQQVGGNVPDANDDGYNALQSKKSPPANGKKTKGRVKIKMEYIDNKLRRYTTFSKRKTGIMKKAYELSTLTGTQVMLLVASETGHVYTFATRKLQPMITSEAGKQLIQTCLNSPDPPSVGGGDQRMSATGFEETELSYNIADEDSKDLRINMSSGNDSEDSSDIDSPVPVLSNSKSACEVATISNTGSTVEKMSTSAAATSSFREQQEQYEEKTPPSSKPTGLMYDSLCAAMPKDENSVAAAASDDSALYPATNLANLPQEVLLQLIQSGHLQLHNEEDGSGHQYVAIPLSSSSANLIKSYNLKNSNKGNKVACGTPTELLTKVPSATLSTMMIKQELE